MPGRISVSSRISRRPPAEKKIFGLAAMDFAKPPAAGRKKFADFAAGLAVTTMICMA